MTSVSSYAFIGDDVTAAGFRLAGVDVYVPAQADLPDLFRRLSGTAGLILITAEVAGWLPAGVLERALVADRPLVLVLADVRGRYKPPDLGAALRRQLGIAE